MLMYNQFSSKLLSKEEVNNYFIKIRAGDKEAKKSFISHNLGLVFKMASKYRYSSYEEEDLVSCGFIGLINAVNSYDVDKGFKFSSYACRCINNEILRFINDNKEYVNNISINEVLRFDDEDTKITMLDNLTNKEYDFTLLYENQVCNETIRKIISTFREVERNIIYDYFGFDDRERLKQTEIADKYGMSRKWVNDIVRKNLIIISKKLKRLGLIDVVYKGRKSRTKIKRKDCDNYET